MWPVGLVTGLALSSPILRGGRFMGWYDGYIAGRKFPVDMAGFAVSVDFLKQVFFFFFERDFIFKKTLFEKLQYLKQEQ